MVEHNTAQPLVPNQEQVLVQEQLVQLKNDIAHLKQNDAQMDARLTSAIENIVEIIKGLVTRVERLEERE